MAINDTGVDPNIDPKTGLPWGQAPPPQTFTPTANPYPTPGSIGNLQTSPLPPGYTRNPDGTVSYTGAPITGPSGTLPTGTVLNPNNPVHLTQPAPPATTTPDSTTGGGGISGGALNQPYLWSFTPGALPAAPDPGPAPTYTAPTFTPPTYTPPPAFSYDSFKAPSYQDAASDPGYQFAVGQGQQALEQSAAARGVLNTGGTLKDLINYGQNAGAQQYNNVLNHDLSIYGTNYQAAAQTYAMNAQSQYLQPYQFAYTAAMDQFAPQMAQFNANVNSGNLGYSTNAAAGNLAYSTAAADNTNNAQFGANFDYNKWLAQRTQAPWQAAFA